MFDYTHKLKDAGAVTSSGYGTVDAAAKVVELGAGLVRGNLVIDVSAIKISAKDEIYEIHLIGGTDADFSSQASLCSKELGHKAGLQGNRDSKLGRIILPFQNEMAGQIFSHVKVRHVIAGSSPSINYTARLEKDLPQTGSTALVTETTTTSSTTTTT